MSKPIKYTKGLIGSARIVDDFLPPSNELAAGAGRGAARLARALRGKVGANGDIVFVSGNDAARFMRKFLK